MTRKLAKNLLAVALLVGGLALTGCDKTDAAAPN